jgi:hypothetical protein
MGATVGSVGRVFWGNQQAHNLQRQPIKPLQSESIQPLMQAPTMPGGPMTPLNPFRYQAWLRNCPTVPGKLPPLR